METMQNKNPHHKVKGRHKRGLGIYMQNILYKQVTLPFHNIGNNIAELLNEKISRKFEGRCNEEGYIKPNSIRLISFSAGEIRGKEVLFTVSFECLVCRPVEGQRFKCIVKNVTKAGIRAETTEAISPVVVFIARDHHHNIHAFSTLKANDEINVRVIGIRYELNDKYISVIAEYVEPKKIKRRPKVNITISKKQVTNQ
jgi:DNA-directed RNA polymerase subunit E'/Rpb7